MSHRPPCPEAQRRSRWAIAAAIGLAMSMAVAAPACNRDDKSAESAGTGSASEAEDKTGGDPIVIAVAGPMTGQYASFGQQMAEGAKQAVTDINAAGGVLGRKLTLEVGDDACDPKQAVAVANQMVQKEAVLVAGHWCSGSSIPASKVYSEEGIVMISPGSTSPKLTDEGDSNVFRVVGRDDQQGVVTGEFLAKTFPDKKMAILHDKTAYGKGLADETKKNLEARGITPVLYEAYTAGEKDYTAVVSKLKQNQVEVVYIGGYHTEAGLIMRQMREQKLTTRLVSGDAMVTEEYWSITGPAGEGTLMTFPPDPRKNPSAADVVKAFRARNVEPEGYVLYTYGAIQAWAQAVGRTGSIDVDAVSKALRTDEFAIVLGTIGFDDNGDVTAPGYVIYEWNDGTYDYYQAN